MIAAGDSAGVFGVDLRFEPPHVGAIALGRCKRLHDKLECR
jgi:hypothetical protein